MERVVHRLATEEEVAGGFAKMVDGGSLDVAR